MPTLLASTPLIRVLVRDEFLFDQQEGHGNFTGGYVVGFCAVRHRSPAFQVLLDNGAMWARVPIQALCVKRCTPLPAEKLGLWDCFGYHFTVVELEALKHMSCRVWDLEKCEHEAEYLLTVDWMLDGFSEIPDQHKNHHLLKLSSGHLAMYPNNRIRWLDKAWIDAESPMPPYRSSTTVWFTEK